MKKAGQNRGKIYFSLIYLTVSVISLIGSVHDAFLYKETAAKIERVQTEAVMQESGKMYEQTMEAQILNGVHKGEQIALKNLYSGSLTVDEKYKKGNQVFVTLTEDGDALEGKITGLKRDTYVLAALLIFVYVLYVTAGRRGVSSILSAGINILLFYVAICLYEKGSYIIPVTILLMILFTVLSLVLVSGINKVTETAVLVLIGGLGAVMDVTISIATTAGELVRINPGITKESLYDGIRHVADDIMGTMINVLFLSYFCSAVPLILIKMINHYGFTEIFKFHIPFELILFLTGSIGILLAIPISLGISVRVLKEKGERA